MGFKITGLRSWNTDTASVEDMVRFYRDGLGAEESNRHQVRGVDVVRLKLGSTGLGLFDGRPDGVPHHTLEFEGPRTPEDMTNELESRGLKVTHTRMHGEGPGYSVYVDDPAGNHLELSTDPT
ncbi:MAG: VOC family protein [Chloroflexi bacterium]|nr:VOC family protein [Chloroflexota bacterium]